MTRVTIERLGHRGEGIGTIGGDRLHVPYALPNEVVTVDREGDRATLVGILERSSDRIAAICPHFTTCGGCAVQALAWEPYAAWKRDLLTDALNRAGMRVPVASLLDAHGSGRRRATFHARRRQDGRVALGFMQARAHEVVPIDLCPILVSEMSGALAAARAIAMSLADSGRPLDLLVTASESGLDVDLRGHGALSDAQRDRLATLADRLDLARLANHGTIVLEKRKPVLTIGNARVGLPPGCFLQATAAGEAALAARVTAALDGAKTIADLFAGIGTFALRLAASAAVRAIDSDAPALAAVDRASREAPHLHPVAVETRDLFRRPLTIDELGKFDALVLDPPRAGAEAQIRAIAASSVNRVVSVSCDAPSFARDAAILTAAGFKADVVEPIDQFRYSAHLEIVAAFNRTPAKRKRRLLG